MTKRSCALLIWLCALCACAWAQKTASLPAGVRGEEVKFNQADVKLAGTLLLPKADAGKRAPAVLLLASYGQVPRDGFKFGTAEQPVYRELAERLAAQGFGVLRYDKRCTGASDCKPKWTFDDLVDDARAALAYLRARAELDAAKLFVLGHGEGGMIASVLATPEEKLAGVVLAASPGRTWNKLLRDQLQRQMQEAGKSEAETTAFIARFDRIVRTLAGGSTEGLAAGLDPKQPFDAVVLDVVNRPEFSIPLFINDPLQVANTIKAPVLIVQGEKDVMVSVKDAQFLNEALTRAQHRDTTLQVLPDVDHLFKTNKDAASLKANNDTARPLDAGFLTILIEWLQKRAK